MSGSRPRRAERSRPRVAAAGLLACLVACAADPVKPLSEPSLTPEELYALELPLSGGGLLRLADYRGRVLALDVFATWSQTSIVAISNYKVFQEKYAESGLSFLGLSVDELGDDVVAPFVAGMQIGYPVALATPRIREGQSGLGRLEAIPSLLLFDRQGQLAVVLVGLVPTDQIEKLIRALL